MVSFAAVEAFRELVVDEFAATAGDGTTGDLA